MRPLTELAPAKINVCLFAGPQRDDGRHELVTVFQALTLADHLTLGEAEHDEVHCPGVEGDNLALAAIQAFRRQTGWDGPPVRVAISKEIPVAGGMAGGSADAAATLRLLARHTGLGDDEMLLAIARDLGADVPAQVRPGRHLGTGAGEVIEALPAIDPYGVVALTTPHRLPTGAVFARARELGSMRSRADLDRCLAAVRASLPSLGDELVVNDLEAAAIDLCPWCGWALGRLRELGADHALVSGSGPTVIGLFAGDGDSDAFVAACREPGARGGLACAARDVASIGNNPRHR